MHPDLFVIPLGQGIQVKAYGFFLALAGVIFILFSLMQLTRRVGISWSRSTVLLMTIGMAVPMGARLLHIITNPGYYAGNPAAMTQFHPVGLALYGGLMLGFLAGGLVCHWMRFDVWQVADALTPGLGFGIAAARIGCFLNGCCFGKATQLPWAVTFPAGSPASLYHGLAGKGPLGLMSLLAPVASKPVHPTQIYELMAAIMGAVLAFYLMKRNARAGTAFLAFIIWFSAFRWVNWTLRIPPVTLVMPHWFYPALYGAILTVAVGVLVLRSVNNGHQACAFQKYMDGNQHSGDMPHRSS